MSRRESRSPGLQDSGAQTGSSGRIARRFAALRQAGRSGLIPFITAGDPDFATSAHILAGLPKAGADMIELGMAFSDPMADGASIQAAGQRALAQGQTLARTLEMVRGFRTGDPHTPVILMGYFNPIYSYGVAQFMADARRAGVDGLIIVDTPLEQDEDCRNPAQAAGLDFIRLVSPMTDEARLRRVLADADGFVYYISITGITGTRAAALDDVAAMLSRMRKVTDLPIAVGFGIRNVAHVRDITRVADAAVVGSALVEAIGAGASAGLTSPQICARVWDMVRELAAGCHIRA